MIKYTQIKNVIDPIIAIILTIPAIPIGIIISILIKMDSKGSVIFKHKRVGKNGKTIYVYKFRTMKQNAEELKQSFTHEQKKEFNANYKLKNDPRITKIGRKLRKQSLDEIPQLINVIKGELALIGPRPITVEELEKYGEKQKELLQIKPGIMGEWTAQGRSNITYKERVKIELSYVKNINLITDLKIMCKTIYAVIKREGAI